MIAQLQIAAEERLYLAASMTMDTVAANVGVGEGTVAVDGHTMRSKMMGTTET